MIRMFGNILGAALLIFGVSFVIGMCVTIIQTLIARKRAARDQNKNDEKEVDQSNHQ